MGDFARNIRVIDEISAYQWYLPEGWAKSVAEMVPKHTVLDRIVLNLLLAWRGAARTAEMPVTAVRAAHAAASGHAAFESPDSSILAFAEVVLIKLARRIPELVAMRELHALLMAELVAIAGQTRDAIAVAKQTELDMAPIWEQFMQDSVFQISLWSAQRVTYVAFYNAYEAFVVDCVKSASGAGRLRVSNKDKFIAALQDAFGVPIADACWRNDQINVARLVRHAISHNGGRETEDLRRIAHGIEVIDGDLQVTATAVHHMLDILRHAVEMLISKALDCERLLQPAQ